MKKIFTGLLLLAFLTSVKAQYVEIESYIVRQKIKELAPDCLDGKLLDTTCTQLSNIRSIVINDNAFAPGAEEIDEFFEDGFYNPPMEINLHGVQYLKELKSIYISIANLTLLADKSNFPNSLESISAGLDFSDEDHGKNIYIGISLPENVKYAYLTGSADRMNGSSVSCGLNSNIETLHTNGCYVNIGNNLPNKLKLIIDEASSIGKTHILPNSLEELKIIFRQFDSDTRDFNLPKFPASLKKLSLEYFRDYEHNIQGEYDDYYAYPIELSKYELSEGLQELSISEIYFSTPFEYPSTLKTLNFNSFKHQSEIGNLPENLESLGVSYCQNGDLLFDNVIFPETLKNLTINQARISVRPEIPNQLENLNLSENALTVLGDLPNSLKSLNITNNLIDVIESLPPQLENLSSGNNGNLKCLPTLPSSLKSLYIAGTKITCIPNETNTIKATLALPLCPEPCGQIPDLLSGVVFLDLNKNGQLDASDRRIQGAFIQADDKILTSNFNGEYRFYANPDASSTIAVTYKHPHLDKILPAQRTYTNSGNSEKIDTMYFAVQLRDVKDVEVIITPFAARNGFTSTTHVTVTNRGTLPVKNFNLSLHNPLHWPIKNTAPAALSIADSILWNNISLDPNTSRTFHVSLTVPATDTIRTPFTVTAKTHQITDDETPQNNTFTFSSRITGSYDPNDKLVYPESLTPGYAEGTELIYTVRFQNTGNDTAFTVVVKDTIQANLDPLSFRFISGTHPSVWSLNEQGVITFTFENILLPDSNINEPASNGQVTFAIQPKTGLASGASVENKAAIYFDFNAPIITNTAVARVEVITSVNRRNTINMTAYPNPAKDIVHLQWAEGGKTYLCISDISGKVIDQSVVNGNYTQLPVNHLSKGMYIVQIQNELGTGIAKVIVQ